MSSSTTGYYTTSVPPVHRIEVGISLLAFSHHVDALRAMPDPWSPPLLKGLSRDHQRSGPG